MNEVEWRFACRYETNDGKKVKLKGKLSAYNQAMSLKLVIKEEYLTEHGLIVPDIYL